MSKKKTILTEDAFNANGNNIVSDEILNESKETNEEVKVEVEEKEEITNTENKDIIKSNIKQISVIKKIGFNDESYYFD